MVGRRSFMAQAALLPVLGLLSRPARAAEPEVFSTEGIAIHGIDPVSYFTMEMPVDGNDDFRVLWHGAIWRFSSEENMMRFEADPHTFAPQYGGYCAYAMSKGAIATSVPEAWTIYEGKLYLNYSTGVREIWRTDIPNNVLAANGYWPDILNT